MKKIHATAVPIAPLKKSTLAGGPLLRGNGWLMGEKKEPLRRPLFPSPSDRQRTTHFMDDVGKDRTRFPSDLRHRHLYRFRNQQTHKSASSSHLASYCPRNKKKLSISSQTRTRLSLRYIIPDLLYWQPVSLSGLPITKVFCHHLFRLMVSSLFKETYTKTTARERRESGEMHHPTDTPKRNDQHRASAAVADPQRTRNRRQR